MSKRIIAGVVLAGFFALANTSIAFPQVQTPSETVEPTIVVFYEEGCPDCIRMDELLEEALIEHPDLRVSRYEINAPGALNLLKRLGEAYGVSAPNVPIIFVGEEAIIGAGRAEEMHLRTAIEDCLALGCSSPLAQGQKPFIVPWGDVVVLAAFFALFFLFYFLQGE